MTQEEDDLSIEFRARKILSFRERERRWESESAASHYRQREGDVAFLYSPSYSTTFEEVGKETLFKSRERHFGEGRPTLLPG